MAYDLDTSNPLDNSQVSLYPDNERTFRGEVSGLIGEEHSSTEGRHAFGIGNETARDAITTWQVGSIWFNTERTSGQTLIDVCASIGPVVWTETLFGMTDVINDWTTLQIATYNTITVGAGSPNTVPIDWDQGNYQEATLTGNSELSISTNKPAVGKGTQMVVEVTQGGAGSYTLAYAGSEYKFAYGIAPVLSTGVGEIDILFLTLRSDGNINVSMLKDSS